MTGKVSHLSQLRDQIARFHREEMESKGFELIRPMAMHREKRILRQAIAFQIRKPGREAIICMRAFATQRWGKQKRPGSILKKCLTGSRGITISGR